MKRIIEIAKDIFTSIKNNLGAMWHWTQNGRQRRQQLFHLLIISRNL